MVGTDSLPDDSTGVMLELAEVEKYFDQSTNLISSLLGNNKQIKAVDGVSLRLDENTTHGIIGESGCGKSTLLRTVIGLHRPTGGSITYKGRDLSTFSKQDLKRYRRDVQIIFQDPYNSMDPKLTVEQTVKEPLIIHDIPGKSEKVREALSMVELNPPEKYLDRYPSQLSGGEKQRVSIARAIIMEPDLILADEPVSMLDVSTQAAILELLSDIVSDLGASMLYISHDLSTVSYVCEKIHVMYLGRVVESAPTKQLINDPKHPYSEALIEAVPIPDPNYHRERTSLKGDVTEPIDIRRGCRFADRCPERMDICESVPPETVPVGDEHTTACHLHYDHNEPDTSS